MTSQFESSREAIGTRADDVASGPVGAGLPGRPKVSEKVTTEPDDVSVVLRGRLRNVLLWLRTAKENLPDLNNGQIPADRVAAASGLVDRLHRLALEAAAQGTARGRRQHRAA